MPRSDIPLDPSPVDPHRLGVVLFDLLADRLPAFAADLRRLTGQACQFRWLPTGDDEPGRVLVQVESPPPLIVWRATDGAARAEPDARGEGDTLAPPETVAARPGTGPASPSPGTSGSAGSGPWSRAKPPTVAYTEPAPGVWVQLGYRHPRPDRIRARKGHILLLRAPDAVEAVPAGAFTEEIETLPLAGTPGAEAPGSPPPPVATRLRLVRTEDREPPRLWVLREDALPRLTTYCRTTHQHLLGRYALAVSASAGIPCAVLRAGTAKGPPPVFVGPAVAYRPLAKLPNVYLPAGTRLVPPLRRDAIQAALNVSAGRVGWVHPLGDGAFRVESLPEAAFRPLQDWVEYRVPEATSPGRPWVQSHRWELPPFVERPEARPTAVPAPPAEPPRPAAPDRAGLMRRTVAWLRKLRRPAAPGGQPLPIEEVLRPPLGRADRLRRARPETANKALELCRELEGRFLQALPTLAPEDQTARWAELAAAYDAVGNNPDAALCWLNALWGQPKPSPLWAWGWLRAEARAGRPEVKAIDPAPWLATAPGPGTTRAMAAWVVWASLQSPPPLVLTERLADLQARLESHEHWLPVRSAWLARVAVARLGRADVLGLARTRDRLSERLLSAGLSLELDTPSFLRFAGEGVRERFQEARRWLADRRDLIHQWVARLPEDAWVRPSPGDPGPVRRVGLVPNVAHTMAYTDLVLAWGLTRFAEHSVAERVRRAAATNLPADDPVHSVLRQGFEYRIAQVREGRPPRGPLPVGLLARIDALSGLPRYAVDKLREHSRVLEPTARVGGYRDSIFRKSAVFAASPAAALDALSADRLDDATGRLLAAEAAREGRPHLAEAVAAALDRTVEMTEVGAASAFEHLPAALEASREHPAAVARLIEKGLAAAALWDRADVARDLAARFLDLAAGRSTWDIAEAPTGQVVRALRRLGLKVDADRVLFQVAERVLRGQPLDRLRAARPADWPAALRVLLHAAAGWYYAGRDEQAHAVLDEARKDLFAPGIPATDRTALALAYATTLGQAPVRVALGRLEEVFQRLRGIDVGGSTNAYYSLQPLLLIETAVRAVVSEDFALGPEVRAWLDADELAVRRRIRDELKDVMSGQGL